MTAPSVFESQIAVMLPPSGVQFFVEGVDVVMGKQRHRVSTRTRAGRPLLNARMYTPARTVNAERRIRDVAKPCFKTMLTGPIVIKVWVHMPIPASWSKVRRANALAHHIMPLVKPDASNVLKLIEDALNNVAYIDDSHIVQATVQKMYSPTPGLMIQLFSLVDY